MVSAAAVFRDRLGELQILLVKTSSGRQFTLPKGHAKSGESAVEAARREAWEESGYRMVGFGERSRGFVWNGEQVEVVVFREAQLVTRGERQAGWYPLEAAVRLVLLERMPAEAETIVRALWSAVARYRSAGERRSVDAAGDAEGSEESTG